MIEKMIFMDEAGARKWADGIVLNGALKGDVVHVSIERLCSAPHGWMATLNSAHRSPITVNYPADKLRGF